MPLAKPSSPSGSSSGGGSSSSNTILAFVGVFFFVLVIWLASSSIGSREQMSHHNRYRERPNVLGEIESYEDYDSSLTRAAVEMCWDVEAKNASMHVSNEKAELDRLNAQSTTLDNLYKKVTIWSGKGSQKGHLPDGPKLWCMTLGMASKPGESEWGQRLWASKCDTNYLYTDATSVPGIDPKRIHTIAPIGGNREENGWQRLRAVLKHVSNHPYVEDYDYFMFAGDSTLVFVENLRKLILEPQTQWFSKMNVPVIYGHRMTTGVGVGFVSGAGFLINLPAMKIIQFAIDSEVCKPRVENIALDLSFAECLREYGVLFSDSVDDYGEDRMHAYNPELLVNQALNPSGTSWYKDYHMKPLATDLSVTSRYTISWNYMTPHLAHSTYEKIYR